MAPAIMVNFMNPHRPANEQISVWCEERYDDGFRLRTARAVGGELHGERCVDFNAALCMRTVVLGERFQRRVQTTLTQSGSATGNRTL